MLAKRILAFFLIFVMTFMMSIFCVVAEDNEKSLDIDLEKFSENNTNESENFLKKCIDFDNMPLGELDSNNDLFTAFSTSKNATVRIVKDKMGNAMKIIVPKSAGNGVGFEIPLGTLTGSRMRVSYDMKIENNSVFARKILAVKSSDGTEIASVSNGFSRINLNGDPGTFLANTALFENKYSRVTLFFDYLTQKVKVYINSDFIKEVALENGTDISSLYFNIMYNDIFQNANVSGDGIYFIDNIEIQNCDYLNAYFMSIEDGEKNVETDRIFYAGFLFSLDESVFTKSNFRLFENGKETDDYFVEYTPDRMQAVVAREDGWKCDTEYTLKIAGNLKSGDTTCENSCEEYEIGFRTVPKADISSLKLYRENGKIKAVTEISGSISDAIIITALYDNSGKLIEINTEKADISSEKIAVSYFGDTEGFAVKSFLWSGNYIYPVCEAKEKDINDSETKPVEIFVSKSAENGDGTKENPFSSIEEARDYIRNADIQNIVVNIREGEYDFSDSIVFDQNDTKNVVYRGYMDEKVLINGAYRLDSSKLIPYKDGIYRMDLSDVPVDLGEVTYQGTDSKRRGKIWSELLVNGEIMTMARYPNEGVTTVKYMINNGSDGVTPLKWKCDDEIVTQLGNCKDLFVYNWFVPKYIGTFEKIGSVDTDEKTVSLAEFHKEESGSYTVNDGRTRSYYFVNALELIDTEGEYYIDRENKILYFYPPKNMQNLDMRLTSISSPLLKINGAKNITFKNLTFSGGKSSGITINEKSQNINFDNVTIRNFGENGISYSLTKSDSYWTYDSKIERSEIFDVGSKGISIIAGDNKDLTSCGIRIYDNKIHKIGRIIMYHSAAVYAHTTSGNWGRGTPGLYIGYNEIYDTNDWAVLASIDTTVEYNNIHDCARYGDDTGAIYWGKSYYVRGRKLLNNYIHDIKTYNAEPTHGVHAVYLDGATGVTVVGNVLENADNYLIFSSDCGMHKIHDNILIGNKESCEKYANGASLGINTGGVYRETSDEIKEQIPEYTYTSPIWIGRYPYLARNLRLQYPNVPSSKIYRNYLVNCNPANITDKFYDHEFALYESNLEINADITFDMLKNNDFSNLPAISGFNYTDYSKIGDIKSKVLESSYGSVIYSDFSELCIKDGKLQKMSEQAGEKLVIGDITIVNPQKERVFYDEAVISCIRNLINMY